MLHSLVCLAMHLSDDMNFAFMDYFKGEKARSIYEEIGSYGTMAPYIMIFHEGKAYHMEQIGAGSLKLF